MTKVSWLGAVGLAVLGVGTLAGWAAGFAGDGPKDSPRDDRTRQIERLTKEADAERARLAEIEAELRHLRGWDEAPAARNRGDKPTHVAREGQKVTLPEYVVEPPDLLIVEVLEALPGRPISGERLVRPDGTITLGYYGNVNIAGLTLSEIKEKIVLHLRASINDETLGLVKFEEDPDNPKKIKKTRVAPRDTDRVFVDVAAYNSKVYYVEGDVSSPGRLPITGSETALDAIHHAGGLAPKADPDHIELIRPAPPGAGNKPQTFKIDFEAITQRGDPTTNYQLMPGDRIYVHRRADAEPDPGPDAAKTEERLSSLERKMDAILGELKALREQSKPE